jgi:hypothetical protein
MTRATFLTLELNSPLDNEDPIPPVAVHIQGWDKGAGVKPPFVTLANKLWPLDEACDS